jgi:hypothetical protein
MLPAPRCVSVPCKDKNEWGEEKRDERVREKSMSEQLPGDRWTEIEWARLTDYRRQMLPPSLVGSIIIQTLTSLLFTGT